MLVIKFDAVTKKPMKNFLYVNFKYKDDLSFFEKIFDEAVQSLKE